MIFIAILSVGDEDDNVSISQYIVGMTELKKVEGKIRGFREGGKGGLTHKAVLDIRPEYTKNERRTQPRQHIATQTLTYSTKDEEEGIIYKRGEGKEGMRRVGKVALLGSTHTKSTSELKNDMSLPPLLLLLWHLTNLRSYFRNNFFGPLPRLLGPA